MDSSDDAIIAKSLDSTVTAWNAGAERLFGYRREEILGRPVTVLFPADRVAEESAIMERIAQGERVEHFETVRRRKDGTTVDVDVTISPLFGPGGGVIGASKIARDITARKHAEKQVREQAELLNLTDDAVFVWSWDGGIEFWNEGAQRLYGYTAAEAGGHISHSLLQTRFPESLAAMRTVLARDGRWEGELVHRTKGGQTVTTNGRMQVITHGGRHRVLESNRDITRAKQAEEQLQASLHRLERVLQNDAVGVMFWDLTSGCLVDANDTFLRTMGYSRQDVADRVLTWQTLTPPEYYAVSLEEVRKFQVTGRVGPYEKEYLRKDGTRQWFVFAGSALGPNACVEFCVDISARKEAEAALRFSEAQFRALYEHATDGMMLTATDGRVLSANPAACRLLGRTEEEIRRAGRSQLVDQNDPRLAALLAEREQTGRAVGELTFLRGDGTPFEAEVSSVVFTSAEGPRTSMIIHDVTPRRRRDQRIREQAELLDKANEAIVAFDLAGGITFWSHGAERLFGWTATETFGQPVALILARSGVDPHAEVFQALARGGDWRGEISGHTRSGRPLTVETSVTEVHDATGRPTGRLSISTDITEHKSLKEQFLRAQRVESIGLLAAGIAHDFNNVLAPIAMAAPILRGHLTVPAHLRLITTVEQCADRGAGLVRQILGFAHGVEGERRPVQMRHLLRDIVGVVGETFQKSITIEHRVAADLWPVLAQPTQIHQVALNLCVNARDAMPAGGRIRVQAENRILDAGAARELAASGKAEKARAGAWVVLTVEDTGTGIPAELLHRIWEPFFTTKGPGKGTGLGLATVRTIVETHQGFLTVDTVVGQGTTFRVYLPAAEQPKTVSAAATTHVPNQGHGERILFVDDEAHVRDTADTILTGAGYHVVTAADGAAGATHFDADPAGFALVITDQDMPNLDGAGLARVVRDRRAGLPILSISGTGSNPAQVLAKDYASAFLPKPFTADALLRMVAELLAKPSAPR